MAMISHNIWERILEHVFYSSPLRKLTIQSGVHSVQLQVYDLLIRHERLAPLLGPTTFVQFSVLLKHAKMFLLLFILLQLATHLGRGLECAFRRVMAARTMGTAGPR